MNFNEALYEDFLYICEVYGWCVSGSLETDRSIQIKGYMMRGLPVYFFLTDSDFQNGKALENKMRNITDSFCQKDNWNNRCCALNRYVFFGFSYEAIDEVRYRLTQLTEKVSVMTEKYYKGNWKTY